MDDLAYLLATGLETPVLNETGITGTYDVRFKVEPGDVQSLNKVLKATLGLELVQGDKALPITVSEVSKEEAGGTSPKAPIQESRP